MQKVRLQYDSHFAVNELSRSLANILPNKEVVIVCVGTDRCAGDSLAPMVGTMLKQHGIKNVWGDLHDTVNAANLSDKLKEIRSKYKDPYIIGIDACLGQSENVGIVQIEQKPLKPGTGVNKDLEEFGDLAIIGVVNVGGFMEYFVLQNTRLSFVVDMAKVISESIKLALVGSEVASSF